MNALAHISRIIVGRVSSCVEMILGTEAVTSFIRLRGGGALHGV